MERPCTLILVIVVLLIVPASGLTWSTGSWNGDIHRMEREIQAQLARIQRAKEIGSSTSALTRYRVAEQLHRAEEELERHRADLERMKENLEDRAADLGTPYSARSGETDQGLLGGELSRLEAQIKAADSLLARVEAFRNSVDQPVLPAMPQNAVSQKAAGGWSSTAKAASGGSPVKSTTMESEPPQFH